jgi:hypothetical protein
MLKIACMKSIEEPAKSENDIQGYGTIILPRPFVSEDLTEERISSVGLAYTCVY